MNNQRPDIGFIGTDKEMITAAFSLAEIGGDDVVYDLGCGDGRVVIAGALEYGVKGVGIDIDQERIMEAQKQALAVGVVDLVEFRLGDLFTCNFRAATVVFLYLLPHLNLKIRPQLWAQLQPGSRVISRDFEMGDWLPEKSVFIETESDECTLYLWRV